MGSSSNASASSGGIGFFGLLAILFIALKLLGIIQWSWLWVLSPIWLPFIVFIAVFAVIVVVCRIASR